jgi:hypothetical protein
MFHEEVEELIDSAKVGHKQYTNNTVDIRYLAISFSSAFTFLLNHIL